MACTTHGRPAAYKAGCRCNECRDANSAAARLYRERRKERAA